MPNSKKAPVPLMTNNRTGDTSICHFLILCWHMIFHKKGSKVSLKTLSVLSRQSVRMPGCRTSAVQRSHVGGRVLDNSSSTQCFHFLQVDTQKRDCWIARQSHAVLCRGWTNLPSHQQQPSVPGSPHPGCFCYRLSFSCRPNRYEVASYCPNP